MRISELTRRTGVTVATIKYYIRQGLLPAGTPISATQAEYDASHVDRLRLIRALVDVGHLPITTVGELLATIDNATDTTATATATAGEAGEASRRTARQPARRTPRQTARKAAAATSGGSPATRLAIAGAAVTATHEALSPKPDRVTPEPERARAAMAVLGWDIDPESAALQQLERALAGLDAVHLPPSQSMLRAYGEAALNIAEVDAGSTPPGSRAEVVRHVVIGTVLYEPVLIALRRLAQQQVFGELNSQK